VGSSEKIAAGEVKIEVDEAGGYARMHEIDEM
jgi:hypothetical protein